MENKLVSRNSFELAQQQYELQKHGDPLESVDEIEMLAKYFYDHNRLRDACMYILQCNTGLRIGDILDFTWDQCLYLNANGEIRHRHETYKIENKTGKARVIRFNQAIAAAVYLHWIQAGQPPLNEYMFTGARGKRRKTMRLGKEIVPVDKAIAYPPMTVRSASRIMTAAAKEAKLWRENRKISTHAIRKTGMSAVAGVTKGAELDESTALRLRGVELAQLMGNHSEMKTTANHYLSLKNQILNDRIDTLNLGIHAIADYCRGNSGVATAKVNEMLAEVTK